MKLNLTGLLFELDKINFRVGHIMTITFEAPGMPGPVAERVRSIKHYDRFFRTPPKKSLQPGETPPEPKRLIEAHFVHLREESRQAITRFLMSLTLEELKKRR